MIQIEKYASEVLNTNVHGKEVAKLQRDQPRLEQVLRLQGLQVQQRQQIKAKPRNKKLFVIIRIGPTIEKVCTYLHTNCKHLSETIKDVLHFSGNAKHIVNDLDAKMCTHLLYSFATLDTKTYEMKVFDKWLDIDLKNCKYL